MTFHLFTHPALRLALVPTASLVDPPLRIRTRNTFPAIHLLIRQLLGRNPVLNPGLQRAERRVRVLDALAVREAGDLEVAIVVGDGWVLGRDFVMIFADGGAAEELVGLFF